MKNLTTRPAPALGGMLKQYRLYTNEFADFDDFPEYPEGPGLVVVGGWGVSYSTGGLDDDGRVTLRAYKCEGPEEGFLDHELYGTKYDTRREASRAAFDAGLLAYMVYEDHAERWERSRAASQFGGAR